MRSPAACSHRSEAYCAPASTSAIAIVTAATATSRRTSWVSSENGASRCASRRSTSSASGHGLARSAAVRATVAPAAPASAFQRRRTCGSSMRAAGLMPPPPCLTEVVEQFAGPPRAAEVDAGGAGPEGEQPPQLGGERRAPEPLGRQHPHRAEPLEPAGAAELLVLLRRRVRHEQAGHAGADHLERGVVTALADRRTGLTSSAPRSATVRRSSTPGSRARAGAATRRRAAAARRSAGAARRPRAAPRPRRAGSGSPTSPPPPADATTCSRAPGRPVALADDEARVVHRHAQRLAGRDVSSSRREAGLAAGNTASRCALASAPARSSWRCWSARALTRMSAQAAGGQRAVGARASSSGTLAGESPHAER